MNVQDCLQQALDNNNHHLTLIQQEKVIHYLQLMQQWNRVYNLTAIKNLSDAILLHVLDSLSVVPYLQGTRIIDVGTGAGLPGIPLALALSDRQFVLLDSNHKKTAFLLQVIAELNLKNVTVLQERVEHFHPFETFDSILTRAFSSLAVMLKTSGHLANKDTLFLAMKGACFPQELQEIPPEFALVGVYPLTIKGLDAERHLIACKKIKDVPTWEK